MAGLTKEQRAEKERLRLAKEQEAPVKIGELQPSEVQQNGHNSLFDQDEEDNLEFPVEDPTLNAVENEAEGKFTAVDSPAQEVNTQVVEKKEPEQEIKQLTKEEVQQQQTPKVVGVKHDQTIMEEVQTQLIKDHTVSDRRKVILKAFPRGNFRLGLEQQPENFVVFPGTSYRWAPSKVGNNYRTGLDKFKQSPEGRKRIADLEMELGEMLNDAFYAKLSVPLDRNKTGGEILDLSKAWDFVVYTAMCESHLIALTKDMRHKKPEAEWYFEDAEAEAIVEAKQRKYRKDADKLIDTLPFAQIQWLLKGLGQNVNGMSELATRNAMGRFLEQKDREVINAKALLELHDKGDTYVRVRALVKDAIATNIIYRSGAQDFMYGDAVLGTTEEQVISKIMDPMNSQIRIAIQQRTASSVTLV